MISKEDKKIFRFTSTNALAFLGDAVYEVFVRKYVISKGIIGADRLHREAIKYVRAESQAKVIRELIKEKEDGFALTEEELSLVKRSRNHKTSAKSRSASAVEYKLATAFEALIGALILTEQYDRAEKIMSEAMRIIGKKGNKNEQSR